MIQLPFGPARKTKAAMWILRTVATLVVCLLAATGCRSVDEVGSGSFAVVQVEGHSEADIAAALARTFAADGYQGGMVRQGEMLFEKFASRGTSLSREGFSNAFYGAKTVNRVRVSISSQGGGKHRVECQAFMVTGGSDPFFQSEQPIAHMRRAPYQALLNKAAGELD